MGEPLLTFCACIDPRRINPQTGHYPGCPDEIIPPECLLPPWEVRTTEERVYVGKGARSEKYPAGKPIYESVTRHELVEPMRAVPTTQPAVATSSPATSSSALAHCPVLVLDTETTGLRRAGHTVGVCEIGLAVIDLSPVPQAVSLLGEMRKRAGEWSTWCGQGTDWKGEKVEKGEKPDQKPDQKPASASAVPATDPPVPSPVAPLQASPAARLRQRKASLPPSMDLFARLPSSRQEPA